MRNWCFPGAPAFLGIRELLPPNARVLDVGCGDGMIAKSWMANRPDIRVEGIDVLVRPATKIPVQAFGGQFIPFEENSFDVVRLWTFCITPRVCRSYCVRQDD
jgi:methylase of polypeptide subunit release factors